MSALPADPRIGTVLQERYVIQACLAEGSMGRVYRAERLQLGRPVAVKFLLQGVAQDEQLRRRFAVEARAMSRLSHPNCVSVIDFGLADVPYLVMDLVNGRSLRAALNPKFPAARALPIARQILSALTHAHGEGIIHRDIKPENILLEDLAGLTDHVRVLDFGLAKIVGGHAALTAGFVLGTPNYMAPEQTGEGVVDERVDVYATTVVLFEMLTGTKPFDGPTIGEVLMRQQTMPPPRLRETAPHAGFSRELEELLLRGMAKAPTDRFASAADLAVALDLLPESGQRATRDLPPAVDATIREPPPGFRIDPPDPQGAPPVVPHAAAPPPARPATPNPRARAAAARIRAAIAATRQAGSWIVASRRRTVIALASTAAIVVTLALAGARDSDESTTTAAVEPPSAPRGSPRHTVNEPVPPKLAAVEDLAARGQRDEAIKMLLGLRRENPRDADYAATLARLYFEKRWWSPGADAFRAAVRIDPLYKQDVMLIGYLINSLQNDKFEADAANFLRDLGATAKTEVREAAKSHPSQRVRARAAKLSKGWSCRGWFCP